MNPASTPTSNLTKRFDPFLFILLVCLLVVGAMSVYSASIGRTQENVFRKQMIFMVIGAVAYVIFWKIPSVWLKRGASLLWAINVVLLTFVLLKGHGAKGATRWINLGLLQFQPSEFSKLMIVITLAAFFVAREHEIKKFSTFALSLLHVMPSALLIFKQPHLGASVVIMVTWAAICLAAGVPTKYLVVTLALASCFGFAFRDKILHGYQRDRIKAMNSNDVQGADYQTHQAKLCYSLGGTFGVGYLKGEQKLRVPEQHNDFIFSVIGEEGGLAACTLVLGIFAGLFFRIFMIATACTDMFGKLCAIGVLGFLSFHTVVNLAMNLEIVPVVGLWLPFLSYGGSAMILCLASMGLVQNAYQVERRTLFK